jgi:hypothetical protein
MVNLSRTKLRTLAGVVAVAGVAALVTPAQAATTPAPVQGKVAEGVQRTVAAGSTTNIVRYNKLYTTPAIPPSKCKEVKVALNTAAGVTAYDKQLMNCLYAAWAPVLKAAGANYKVKPTLIVHNHSKVSTYCGVVSGPTSYFCGYKNGQIYIPWGYIATMWKQNPTYARAYATNTLAHEYGHHVQYLTGILDASWARQRALKTNASKLEESRRRELQASCLGSAYIGANKRYYPMSAALYQQWQYLVTHSGDLKGQPRDHGSFANHGWWSNTGFNASSTKTYAGHCNTFKAAPSRVS